MRPPPFASIFSTVVILISVGLIGYVLLQQRDNIERLVPELVGAFISSPTLIQGEIINLLIGLFGFLIYSVSDTLVFGLRLVYWLACHVIGARSQDADLPAHPSISASALLCVYLVYCIASVAVVARLYQTPAIP